MKARKQALCPRTLRAVADDLAEAAEQYASTGRRAQCVGGSALFVERMADRAGVLRGVVKRLRAKATRVERGGKR